MTKNHLGTYSKKSTDLIAYVGTTTILKGFSTRDYGSELNNQ